MHDSGAHLGLGFALRVRVRVEVLVLRALGHILRLHILRRLLQLLTAYRLGAGEAGGRLSWLPATAAFGCLWGQAWAGP